MERSCWQFRSNSIVNLNDGYWRQKYDNCGTYYTTKQNERVYHGGRDTYLPVQTRGCSRYRPYPSSPRHTPVSNNKQGIYQTRLVHHPPKFQNTARKLDLGQMTDRPHPKSSRNFPSPLESYQTQGTRIRTSGEIEYTREQTIHPKNSPKRSTNSKSSIRIKLQNQEDSSETLPFKVIQSYFVRKGEDRISGKEQPRNNQQHTRRNDIGRFRTKRPRPLPTSPANISTRQSPAQSFSPEAEEPIKSKDAKFEYLPKQGRLSSLDEVIVPEISQYDFKPEHTDDGETVYLGQGMYGYVVKGKLAQDDGHQTFDVASKYFRPKLSTKDDIITEAKIQLYLEDTGAVPKVHGLIKQSQKDNLPVLVQECVGEGTTAEDRLAKDGSKVSWLKFCLEAAKGLHKIHQKQVLLNDIKFDNILIEDRDNRLAVKFVDFGLASYKSSFLSGKSESEMVDCHHIAPEVKKQGPSTFLSDIFSLGYVISQIGKETNDSFIVTLGKLLTSSDPSLRVRLTEFIPFVEAMVSKEETKAAKLTKKR